MASRLFVPPFALDFDDTNPSSGIRAIGSSRAVLVVAGDESLLEKMQSSLEQREFEITTESDFERAFDRVSEDPGAYAALVTVFEPTLPASIRLAERVRAVAPEMGIVLCAATPVLPRVHGADVAVASPTSDTLADVLTVLLDAP